MNLLNFTFDFFQHDLEFIDYSNLDSHGRDELISILRSNIDRNRLKLPWDRGEEIYHEPAVAVQPEPTPKLWEHYGNSTFFFNLSNKIINKLTVLKLFLR